MAHLIIHTTSLIIFGPPPLEELDKFALSLFITTTAQIRILRTRNANSERKTLSFSSLVAI
jgi:hypothetical protein